LGGELWREAEERFDVIVNVVDPLEMLGQEIGSRQLTTMQQSLQLGDGELGRVHQLSSWMEGTRKNPS